MIRKKKQIVELFRETRQMVKESWALTNEQTRLTGLLENEIRNLRAANSGMGDLLDDLALGILSLPAFKKCWQFRRGLHLDREDLSIRKDKILNELNIAKTFGLRRLTQKWGDRFDIWAENQGWDFVITDISEGNNLLLEITKFEQWAKDERSDRDRIKATFKKLREVGWTAKMGYPIGKPPIKLGKPFIGLASTENSSFNEKNEIEQTYVWISLDWSGHDLDDARKEELRNQTISYLEKEFLLVDLQQCKPGRLAVWSRGQW